jgi:hypothetical protein
MNPRGMMADAVRPSVGQATSYPPAMGDRKPDPVPETTGSDVEFVFPEDPDVRGAPDMAHVHKTIPPEGPPVGDVDPDQIIPRWQWG